MRLKHLFDRVHCYWKYPALRRYFKIPTHLTDVEKVCLYKLASEWVQPKERPLQLVEIGSYLGASACFLAAGLKKSGRDGAVYCIDTWSNEAMSEGARDTMQEFLANTRDFLQRIVPMRGWSSDVVAALSRQRLAIDLLFIDGDHSYESCLADWHGYSALLSQNSIVVMHDIGWAEGVKRVVDEEIRPLAFKEGRLPNLWWGWIKK